MMHGIVWAIVGMLICVAVVCVVIGVVSRFGHRTVDADTAPTGDGDAGPTH